MSTTTKNSNSEHKENFETSKGAERGIRILETNKQTKILYETNKSMGRKQPNIQ